MKSRFIFFFFYQAAFIVWCFHIHAYFSDFSVADRIAIIIIAFLPLAAIKIDLKLSENVAIPILVLLPLALFPFIDFLRVYMSDSWICIYVFLIISGVACMAVHKKIKYLILGSLVAVWFIPYSFRPNQIRYYDKLAKTINTRNSEIDIVKWKNDQWIYHNNVLSLSSADGHIYTETLVHTVLPAFENPSVLLVGGDHGFTSKEIDKYSISYDHIPYDREYVEQQNNHGKLIDQDIHEFLLDASLSYDIIIIDLPDPVGVDFEQFYTLSFYRFLLPRLKNDGVIITNAGNVHSEAKYNEMVKQNLINAKLLTVELQAQVPTLGHRSWIIASKTPYDVSKIKIPVATKWINEEAILMMQAKGKSGYPF